MKSLVVEIVLHGLIALVPHYAEGTPPVHRMTALVLDSSSAPSMTCVDQHHASITFYTETAICIREGCNTQGRKCTCALDREQISLSQNATSRSLFSVGSEPPRLEEIPTERPRPLPFNNTAGSAGSPAYIANFSHLGVELDHSFLDDDTPRDILEARFEFPYESLLACRLGTRPDDESHNVHPLRFRVPNELAASGDLLQAVAQQLVARVKMEYPEGETLNLVFESLDDDGERTFPLETGRIELTNHRRQMLPKDHVCNDGVGRDFAMLYEFAQSPPPLGERKIPFVKHTQFKSFVDINPFSCDAYKGPLSRPICPMAMFAPTPLDLEAR